MSSDAFFFFYYYDFDEDCSPTFAKSPVSALARERHPMFVELSDAVETLCDNDPHFDGVLLSSDEVKIPVGRPLDDPMLARLNAQPMLSSVPEQLNLFSLEELGEFYVGPTSPRVIETLVGAVLLDFHDAREGSLACAEFNRAVAEGWNPETLRDRALELCNFLAYAARKAGVAVIEYFRTYAMDMATASS
jgi:hypothetical protein